MVDKRKRKKRKRQRKSDWEARQDTVFSRDLRRHMKTNTEIASENSAPELPEGWQPNGIVVSHTKKYAFVEHGGEERLCWVSEGLVEGGATILAPGDEVYIEEAEGDWMVLAVAPRRTRLSRMAIEHSRVAEQVIAANVDVLVIVIAAKQPAIKPQLVDRYLISAVVGGVEPILCVNKMDLVDSEPEIVSTYRELGVKIILTSAETNEGIEELREALRGRLSVFAGQSGVGKSSLLNHLDPSLDIATQTVSEATEKGKHTTTRSQLHKLAGGIRVIDTPGVRKLGLWEVTEETLSLYFPEMAERVDGCKFRNCTHSHEPGCAVRAAVDAGEISELRYKSYLRIRDSLETGR